MNDIPETVTQELDRINPQRKYNLRKLKKTIKNRAAKLTLGTYAVGCRQHPGLIVERNYWPTWSIQNLMGADVTIKSLIDGIEENCSIFNCAPLSVPKEKAEYLAHQIRTMNVFDVSLANGYPLEKAKDWLKDWLERGVLYYVLEDQNGVTVQSHRAFDQQEANEEIARGERMIAEGHWKNTTNLRIVEVLTYPAPIASPELLQIVKEHQK